MSLTESLLRNLACEPRGRDGPKAARKFSSQPAIDSQRLIYQL